MLKIQKKTPKAEGVKYKSTSRRVKFCSADIMVLSVLLNRSCMIFAYTHAQLLKLIIPAYVYSDKHVFTNEKAPQNEETYLGANDGARSRSATPKQHL